MRRWGRSLHQSRSCSGREFQLLPYDDLLSQRNSKKDAKEGDTEAPEDQLWCGDKYRATFCGLEETFKGGNHALMANQRNSVSRRPP